MEVSRLLSLPIDIICEICSRLSVKELIPLTCVCKYFGNLVTNIDDPNHLNFVYFHLRRANQNKTTRNLVMYNCYLDRERSRGQPKDVVKLFTKTKFTNPFDFGPNFWFIGSGNGIICFVKLGADDGIYLWNPALRQIKYVETNQNPCANICSFGFLGFSYDVSSQDYKFVQVTSHDSSTDVYSLKNNSWKHTKKHYRSFSSSPRYCFEHSVHDFNGCLYWTSLRTFVGIYSCMGENAGGSVLSFNIASEELSEYLIQDWITDKGLFCGLGVFMGKLSFLIYYCTDDKYEIWSKEESSDDSWTKVRRFNHNHIPNSVGPSLPNSYISKVLNRFMFTPGGKILEKRKDVVILFDLETECMDITKTRDFVKWDTCVDVVDYVESLITVRPDRVIHADADADAGVGGESTKKNPAWIFFRCFS